MPNRKGAKRVRRTTLEGLHQGKTALAASSGAQVIELRPADENDPLGPLRPPTGEIGVSGTTNLAGRLYTESNLSLVDERGYGQPGTRVWGEWEHIGRTDSAVSSALDLIVAPLRDAEIDVKPGGTDPVSVAQAEFVKDNLQNWLDPVWSELAQQMARGFLGYGFALYEPVWETRRDSRLPGGRGHYVAKLAQRLPNTLGQNSWIERNGDLVEVRQRGIKDGRWMSDLPLPASRILLLTWNREGNNYAGFSAFRPVWYLCKIREQLLRIIGIAHQRESCGVPIASIDLEAKLTGPQRARLQTLLENSLYHENAAVVLPAGVKLEWWTSPGANKGHVIETWRTLGIAIMEQLQAQQTALGTGETGSRSVGEIHDANKNSYVLGVKATIEAALNGVGSRAYTGLVKRLVDFNWGVTGEDAPARIYPKVSINLPVTELGPVEFVNAAKAAKEGGLVTWTQKDENKLRERVGLEQIDDNEEGDGASAVDPQTALNGAQVAALLQILEAVAAGRLPRDSGVRAIEASFPVTLEQAEQLMGEIGRGFQPSASAPQPGASETPPTKPPGAGSPPSPASSGPSQADPGEKPEPTKAFSREAYVPRRTPFAHEYAVDFAAINEVFSTAAEKFQEQAKPLLIEMLVRAMPEVKAAMADGDPSEIAGLRLDTGRLEAFVLDFLDLVRAEGYRHVEAEKQKKPEQVAEEHKAGELTPTAPGAIVINASRMLFAKKRQPRQPAEQRVRRLIEAQRDLLIRRMRSRTIDELQRSAIEKVRTGGDPEAIVSDVVSTFLETKALKQDAGLVVNSAYNLGREEFAEKHGEEVESVRLSAMLDASTCANCAELDGAEFEFGSPEYEEHVPPLVGLCDGNQLCRCVAVFSFRDQGFAPEEES